MKSSADRTPIPNAIHVTQFVRKQELTTRYTSPDLLIPTIPALSTCRQLLLDCLLQ